jgi:hypothetical protein
MCRQINKEKHPVAATCIVTGEYSNGKVEDSEGDLLHLLLGSNVGGGIVS